MVELTIILAIGQDMLDECKEVRYHASVAEECIRIVGQGSASVVAQRGQEADLGSYDGANTDAIYIKH